MSDKSPPALTPEQWEARDYRQVARELDQWAKARSDAARSDDATEYVAKIGVDDGESVVLMNRAHDRVVVPPPARAALAAFALLEQPFGFTAADVQALRRAAEGIEDSAARESLLDLSRRLEALLPAASD
jgi:hypothetical protein